MDVLSSLSEKLLATVNGVGAVVTTVLEVNYVLAATVVQLISQTTCLLSTLASLFYDFLVCSFEDFQFFVTEVFGCLHYLVKFCAGFVEETSGLLSRVASGVGLALGTLRNEFASAVGSLVALSGTILRTISYVASVFVDALLVLLQCVPNGVVFLVRCLLGGVQWVLTSARDFVWRAKNSAVRNTLTVVDAIHKIPVDVYVGLMVMVAIYVLYRKTALGYYMSPAKLARTARRVFRSTLRFATRVTLHRIPNTGRRLASCILGCLSYFADVVRSWFVVDGSTDDDEEETAAPHPRSLGEGAAPSSSSEDGGKMNLEDLERLRKELEHQKERNLCIICQDQPKSVILLPCRHFCLCEECCSELLDRRSTCPLCRTPILSPIQVFV